MAKNIRVLIADDHALVRQGIRQFLAGAEGIEVVGEAESGLQAVELAATLQLDVALLDIQMPGMNGVEATRRIRAAHPSVRVLIVTAYDDDPYVAALLQAGADGYLLKTADLDELVGAVRRVAQGESALSPQVLRKVLDRARRETQPVDGPAAEALSERELAVLRLAARGLTNKAIGLQLGISARTAQGHMANVYAKLGVASRTEAVTEALKRGWIVLE